MNRIKFEDLNGWLKLAAIAGWVYAGFWSLVLVFFVLMLIAFGFYA